MAHFTSLKKLFKTIVGSTPLQVHPVVEPSIVRTAISMGNMLNGLLHFLYKIP